jgi:hypothetical protein
MADAALTPFASTDTLRTQPAVTQRHCRHSKQSQEMIDGTWM